ncbi:MAG: ROK family protein [Saccharofermentanales bacterium]
MSVIIGNQQLARITNQKLIIDIIREKGPLSRAGISKSLKLSAPTVSCNIDKLINNGIIHETGIGDSSGGRKPIMLEFNYNYGNIVGIDLSGEVAKFALGNLKPEIIQEVKSEMPSGKTGKETIYWFIEKIDGILQANRNAVEKLMAVSIAFPGVVDPVSGKTKSSIRFGDWIDLDIKKIFEDHYNVPLLINNDINTAVLGELRYGCGNGYKNMAYIGVDVGIGAGIVINGALYEGSRFTAGEMSRIILPDGTYLESVLTVTKIVENIKKNISSGTSSILKELSGGDTDKIDFGLIVKALELKDEFCVSQIKRYAEILGIAIANMANILDFEIIIIGNEIVKLGNPFIDTIKEVVSQHVDPDPVVMYSKLDTKTVIYGTFAVCLNHVFSHIIE